MDNWPLRSQNRLASNQPFREEAVPKLPIVRPWRGSQTSPVPSEAGAHATHALPRSRRQVQ